MKIMITGLQGSGKTTQAEILAKRLGLKFINTGAEMRKLSKEDSERGRCVKDALEKGILVPNEIVAEIVKEKTIELEKQGGFITDGYPRTLGQLDLFDPGFDQVFYLDLTDEIAIQRLLSRGRGDDTPELIKQRLSWYHLETKPLLKRFEQIGNLIKINGNQEIEQVTKDILNNLKGSCDGQTSHS